MTLRNDCFVCALGMNFHETFPLDESHEQSAPLRLVAVGYPLIDITSSSPWMRHHYIYSNLRVAEQCIELNEHQRWPRASAGHGISSFCPVWGNNRIRIMRRPMGVGGGGCRSSPASSIQLDARMTSRQTHTIVEEWRAFGCPCFAVGHRYFPIRLAVAIIR